MLFLQQIKQHSKDEENNRIFNGRVIFVRSLQERRKERFE